MSETGGKAGRLGSRSKREGKAVQGLNQGVIWTAGCQLLQNIRTRTKERTRVREQESEGKSEGGRGNRTFAWRPVAAGAVHRGEKRGGVSMKAKGRHGEQMPGASGRGRDIAARLGGRLQSLLPVAAENQDKDKRGNKGQRARVRVSGRDEGRGDRTVA